MGNFPDRIPGAALWQWRQQAIAQAQAAEIDRAEVDWLLTSLCQVEALSLRLGTLAQQPEVAAQVSLSELNQRWQRRMSDRVPLQHLVGHASWRNFRLRVSPAVLIPRPETELMIDLVVAAIAQTPSPETLQQGTWVDLGTGSGAIALGLAEALPQAEILAVDVSAAALEIARQNAADHGLGDRVQFLQGSWFEPLMPWQGNLAGVVANPPYIPSAIVPTLQPEVADHEPALALDGGQDGLDSVRHLITTAPLYLKPDGIWVVELMIDQAPRVMSRLAQTQQYTHIQAHCDLAGVERFVMARRASR